MNTSIASDSPAVQDHPQRLSLHHEIHARPPIALWPNERVINQAFLLENGSRQELIAWIDQITRAFPLHQGSASSASIRVLELSAEPSRILLKWEMHGEFVSITLFAQQPGVAQFQIRDQIVQKANALLSAANAPTLSEIPGPRMVALDITLENAPFYRDAYEVAKRFSGNTVIGSVIMTNQDGQLWTDLQMDDAGFVHMLVRGEDLGSRATGRAVQRLIDIETYRMMALLALPHAKAMAEPLRNTETALAELSQEIARIQKHSVIDTDADARLLTGVSALAAQVEGWISANGLRFTAAEAYHELVRRSLAELHETTIAGVQMLCTFMDRRFEPAMRTCRWTQRRLQDLSDRISRTTQILRTRIEYGNETQTQSLLASMDRRAKLQLRLQQTVEGLSVIVMTYYATSLVQYIAKGAKDLGAPVDPEITGIISVPVIAIALIIFLALRKKRYPI